MTIRRSGAVRRPVWHSGFTLIELLVVVAIIALLISILLPSLSKAREQSRTVLCASRIAQMTKSMMIYAEDFNETPPFIIRDADTDDPLVNSGENRKKEIWLAAASTMQRIYLMREEDWYTVGDPRLPESGLLYPYARFTSLYRCPEFERISGPDKYQNVFNYTRSIFGNKANIDELGKFDKGLLKMSGVYNTAKLPMMVDESWNCSVAYPISAGWVWGGIDPMYDALNSCFGQYHGPKLLGFTWYPDTNPPGSEDGIVANDPQKSATVSYYDGHAGTARDPMPNVEVNTHGRAPLNPLTESGHEYIRWILELAYAQQGIVIEGY